MAKKSSHYTQQQRRMRSYQIIMGVVGVLVIISMVLALFVK